MTKSIQMFVSKYPNSINQDQMIINPNPVIIEPQIADIKQIQISMLNNIVDYLKLFEPFALYSNNGDKNSVYFANPSLQLNNVSNSISIESFDKNCALQNRYNSGDKKPCYFVQQYQAQHNQLKSECVSSSTTGCVTAPDISILKNLPNDSNKNEIIDDINNIVNYLKLLEPFALFDDETCVSSKMYSQNRSNQLSSTNLISTEYFDANCASTNNYNSGSLLACSFVQRYQAQYNQLQSNCVPYDNKVTGCVTMPNIKNLNTLNYQSSEIELTNMINNITTYLKLLEPFAIYDNDSCFDGKIYNFPGNSILSTSYFDYNCAHNNRYNSGDGYACYFVQQYQAQHGQLQKDCIPNSTTGCVSVPDISTLSII